ncbi:MAG TPA: Ig-like domain-containing protein [Vicinamibacterales bacterium]|nr:Ig-like domain-containing protein [Vicinamibacterales bacterium]
MGGASLSAGTYKIYVGATDAAGNIAHQAFTITVVDAPSVSSIVRAGGASPTVNTSTTSIDYDVTFSESVTGVDAGDFSLTATGTAAASIASVVGGGMTYTVTVDTLSGDGTLRLDLNNSGTGIKNGNNVDIASGYTSGSTYTLDHTAPSAPSTPDMTSGTDSGTSNIDNITSDDTPTFTGTAESGSTVALYDTDGTTVLGSATATGGNWSITASALSSGSHTITAKATDAAGNVSSASSGLAVTIDTTAPTVASVAVPANGTYIAGQTLSFTVNGNEALTVNTGGGTPRLALTIGSATVHATYVSGSGSTALLFSYTVQAGDNDSDGIAVSALENNGGTLRDTAGNSLNLTLNSVGATTAVRVDTTAPTVTSVAVPSNGTYYANQNLDFTVNFSEAASVNTGGGTPRIALTLDTGGTVYASYLSGSGTTAVVFRYAVASGVQDLTGITIGALDDNGGTIRDAAGNDATLTLNNVGSTAAVNVDGTQAQVLNVTATTANGGYKAGDSVSITITFSQAVTVTTAGGTPTLALNSGGSANYASGSGSTTLVFNYTVGAGQNSADLDYTATSALALNGGTINDSGSGQAAILTLAAPGAAGSLGANKAIVIDTTAPTISFSNIDLSADSGVSSSDFITRIGAQTITATLSAAPAGGDVVHGSVDNGATWSNITSKVSGTALSWDGATLIAGGEIALKVADAVGNEGAITAQAYTLDTTAPAAPSTPDMTNGSDSGISNTDNITAINTPSFTGSAEAGSTVTLYDSDGTTSLGATTAPGGSWTITSSALSAGTHSITAVATDVAGNDSAASGGLSITIVGSGPTVTDANISLSGATGRGGTFKTGDTVTASWNNSANGDNNATPIASVTVDFTAFGGPAAVAASERGGTWSASHTLTEGSIDATDRNVSVTAKDAAGNSRTTADSSNAVVDTVAPQVSDAQLSISGATGANGRFILGDTVTARWNNRADGDNNPDIVAVTVDFSQFGGAAAVAATNSGDIWTAQSTIGAGSSGSARNIALTAIDDAGLTTTTSDSSNATIDAGTPTATIVVSDSALIVGETALVTIAFSQPVSGFDNSDLAVTNATLSAVTSSDGGSSWNATLTPNADVEASSNVITLNLAGVSSLAGFAGTGTTSSNVYAIDTRRPSAQLTVAAARLTAGQTTTLTVTFSEAVVGFDVGDLNVPNATLSALTSSDAGARWTATLTPAANIEAAANVITLNNAGVTDRAGNPGSGTTSSNSYAVATRLFTVGGSVNGLSANARLVLDLNATQTLTISTDGVFTFATGLADGSGWRVNVAGQPSGQLCTVSNGSGTIAGANVNSVQIDCSIDRTPSPPRDVVGQAGDGQILVTWTAPNNDGGSPITGYIATAAPATGGPGSSCTTTTTQCVIGGLVNGTAYLVSVVAHNAEFGSAAARAAQPITPFTAPAPPTNVAVLRSESSATVSWTPPADDGGMPITQYTVTAEPGGLTCTVSGNPPPTTCTISGLQSGVSYSFSVRARSAAGVAGAPGGTPGRTATQIPATSPWTLFLLLLAVGAVAGARVRQRPRM